MMTSGWDLAGWMIAAGLVMMADELGKGLCGSTWLEEGGTYAILEAPKRPTRSASLRFGGGLGG